MSFTNQSFSLARCIRTACEPGSPRAPSALRASTNQSGLTQHRASRPLSGNFRTILKSCRSPSDRRRPSPAQIPDSSARSSRQGAGKASHQASRKALQQICDAPQRSARIPTPAAAGGHSIRQSWFLTFPNDWRNCQAEAPPSVWLPAYPIRCSASPEAGS